MLTVESRKSITPATINFANFAKPVSTPWIEESVATTQVNLLFAASQLTVSGSDSSGHITTDPWGNPIIALSPVNYVHHYAGDIPYAIVGQPFWGWPGIDITESYSNYTVSAPYSYFSFQCDDPYNTTVDEIIASTPHLVDLNMDSNVTDAADSIWLNSDSGESAWMASIPPDGVIAANGTGTSTLYYAMNHKNADLGIVSNETWSNEVAFWKCSYFTQYVQVQYQCWNGGLHCALNMLNDYSLNLTSNSTNVYLTDTFIINFLESLGTPVPKDDGTQFRSLLSQSIIDNGWLEDNNVNPDPSIIDGYMMQQKLTTLVNAYWQLGFTYSVIQSGSDGNSVLPNQDQLTVSVHSGAPVYNVHWAWFTVLVFSCVLLLGFGITGIILDSQTIGPDILGFASSLTRDNRYIKLEDEDLELGEVGENSASSKNAYETMKDLKHHKVMLQDVRGHQDVGKIALGSVGLANGKPLSRERLYR